MWRTHHRPRSAGTLIAVDALLILYAVCILIKMNQQIRTIVRHFMEVAQFIDSALSENGKVFVNCVFGRSRYLAIIVVMFTIICGCLICQILIVININISQNSHREAFKSNFWKFLGFCPNQVDPPPRQKLGRPKLIFFVYFAF